MVYNIVVLPDSVVRRLSTTAEYKSDESCNSQEYNFHEHGLRRPCIGEYNKISKQALKLGWTLRHTTFIVSNEKKWFLTKIKYGI